MLQNREQMWWLAACVVGLLVAAWAAGGFIGPLMAVFIVLFLAGAVLIQFDGRDGPLPDASGAPEPVEARIPDGVAEPEATDLDEITQIAEADAREAARSLA